MIVAGVIEDFGPTDLFQPCNLLASIKCAQKKFAWMDNFGSTVPFVRLDVAADIEKVRKDLLNKYMDYWSYYKPDNSTNVSLWGASVTRLDKAYFSDLESYSCLRKGDRGQVELLFFVALVLLISFISVIIQTYGTATTNPVKTLAQN